MTRHTVDTINSDALDALYEQLEAAEATESQRQLAVAREALASATTRAARAEAAIARVRHIEAGLWGNNDQEQRHVYAVCHSIANSLRVALDQAQEESPTGRQCCELCPCTGAEDQVVCNPCCACGKPAAWTPPPPGSPDAHVYLSTGCFHGDHDYCKSMTGLGGAKRPGECKKCGAKCVCPCHTTAKEQH